MSKAVENLMAAQQHAMRTRPKVGGFPYLAEALRRSHTEYLEPPGLSKPFSDQRRSRDHARCTDGTGKMLKQIELNQNGLKTFLRQSS
jgi:hypothetical protein